MSESPFPPPQTISALLIVVTILHCFAVLLTSFRLWFRYHTRRLWWDDFWAALALLCNVVSTVVEWLSFAPLNDPYTNFEALPTPAQSSNVHVIAAWMAFLAYTCLIWFSRISIAFSVVRIVPPAGSGRMAAIISGGFFFCLWAYMFVSKTVVCSTDDSWHNAVIILCALPEWIAISEVSADVISDLVLVALPFCLLWRVKLPPNQRILVLCVFSTSILVSIVSAVHTAYILPGATFLGPLTAELGGAISLIVCNLLVVVTFIYRVTRNGRDLSANLNGKLTSSSHRLTTVDLDIPGTWFSSRSDEFTSTGITGTNVSSVAFVHPGNPDTVIGAHAMVSSTVPEDGSSPLGAITLKK